MEKKSVDKETFCDRLLRRLSHMTDEDGNFVYPGDSDIYDRTGSGLPDLVNYAFEKTNEKPIDYDLFRDFLINEMKIHRKFVK
jgi:hypothetical protein